MKLIDITVPIRPEMPTYPGDPTVHMAKASAIAEGAVANITRLDFGVHTGTHIDAPLHFLEGAGAAETIPLDALVGPVEVVDATDVEGDVDESALAGLPDGTQRVLFKTRNSEFWAADTFQEGFAKLAESAAREVVQRGIRLVGIDYLSIGGPDAHRVLLTAGVVPVEGLDLRGVEPGRYRLICLPMKITGSDGAPARAVLIRD